MQDDNFRKEPRHAEKNLVMTLDMKFSHVVAALVATSLGASLLPKSPMNLGQDYVDLVVLNASMS